MNLTLIKNFFLPDRKSIEPGKVSRVLRRSFRMKRSKQTLDSHREKRKSGKIIFPLFRRFQEKFRCNHHQRDEMISHLMSTVLDESVSVLILRHFLTSQIHLSTAKNGRYREPCPIFDSASSDRSTPANRRWFIATWPVVTCKRSRPKAVDSRRRFRSTTKVICCWYETKVVHRRCKWVCWCDTAVFRLFSCLLLLVSPRTKQLIIAIDKDCILSFRVQHSSPLGLTPSFSSSVWRTRRASMQSTRITRKCHITETQPKYRSFWSAHKVSTMSEIASGTATIALLLMSPIR